MTFGRVLHTEKGTSGTTYRVREVVETGGVSSLLAITIGTDPDVMEIGRIHENDLPDVSAYIDGLDEETRCLLAEARAEFGA